MLYDAVIVGGSYAGLSAAMQLARARRKVYVVDSGQPRNRFTDLSHGFFGQDGTPPLDLIAQGRSKLAPYSTVEVVNGLVVEARPDNAGSFLLTLDSGTSVTAAKLVLAFGLQDHLPDVPGLAERWGKTVLHCPYCHGFEFRDQPLGVLNVNSFSIHQALLVSDWGPTTLFLNGQDLLDGEARGQLQKRGVRIETGRVVALEGAGVTLTHVRLAEGRAVPVSALYVGPQTRLASKLAEQLGCAMEESPTGPVIRTNAAKMTTVPGVYAAGDIALAMHNATFASADGVLAGVSVHRALIFEPLSDQ